MGEVIDFSLFKTQAFFSEQAKAYTSGWRSHAKPGKPLRRLYIRPDRDLPFYCQPIKLFVISWLVMLGALSFRISYNSYPDMGLPLLLFGISLTALLCGYGWMRYNDPTRDEARQGDQYTLNVSKLRRLNQVFVVLSIAIMFLNLRIDGLPPAFGLFSFDTKGYLEYGRLKQLLFPLLITIVVNSSLDTSRFCKILFSIFALFSMLLYITRGEILAALLQTFFVFSMTTRLTKKKLLVAAAFTILGLMVVADVIGNNRTVQTGFLEFLQIRGQFWEWPMISLWVITYFSIPLSNLCWIVRDFHFHSITFSFLYPTLPAFWTPTDPHELVLSNTHVIDGVHTYLANYYMDFSFVGILLINFALGMACAYLMRRGISRYFLTSAIFLSCMADIFFVDNFTPLSTLLQVAMQAMVQWYVLSPVRARAQGGRVPVAA